MIKSELRSALRARRRAFVATRGNASLNLDEISPFLIKLLQNNDFVISSYISSVSECDVMPPLLGIKSLENRLALPCANSKADRLIFRKWSPSEPLEVSPLGFSQPLQTASQLPPNLILTPLLGFDRSLARLGQGAGHYDRAFEDFPDALRVGVAWSCQEVDAIPCDDWDVPLDAIMTEVEWITGPHSRLEHQT